MPKKSHAQSPRNQAPKAKTSGKTLKALEKKLALMGYVRGKDWSAELIENLQQTEQALDHCAVLLKAAPAQSAEESEIIERLQALEIQRFQLLGQLYGNRVNHYNALSF